MQTKIKKIAIVSGQGDMPLLIINECIEQKIDYFALPIVNQAEKNDYVNFDHEWFAIGEIGKVFSIIKRENISHLILAGGVHKPNFSDIKVDMKGASLLAKIMKAKFIGDNNLLSLIIDYIEKQGVKVIGIHEITKKLFPGKGALNKVLPSKEDILDIEIASEAVKTLGELDIGQSAIIEKKIILAVEAAEGTDELIKRSKNLKKYKNKAGVLVKLVKPHQNLRVDLPSIGEQTVRLVYEAGLNGIAVSADNALILRRAETIELANKLNIFLYGV